VQAGPTDPDLLDQGHFETGRRAVQRGRVPSRTATQDHDVELLGQDGHLLELTVAARSRAIGSS
jgi:hypothetical protein